MCDRIRPAGRGRACLAAWGEAVRYVFCATDAREIVTRVPAGNAGAGFAARVCGFRERFTRERAFRTAEGDPLTPVTDALNGAGIPVEKLDVAWKRWVLTGK